MKRVFRPFMDAVHNQLEQMKFYRSPRARSIKARRYEQIDLTREFEIRAQRRESEKQRKLTQLYENHDKKAAQIRAITPVAGQSDLSEGEGMTTDGEEGGVMSKRQLVMQAQEKASKELLEELKSERDELVAEFDKDTDLKTKILVQGIHKVSVLGVIKYHQIRHALFEEVSLHPEILKGLEILHYHVENNLPIEKELVYKLVPELFVHEINKLGFKERQRFKKPRISYTRADGESLEVDDVSDQLLGDESDQMFEKSMAMEMYVLEQTSDVFKMYKDELEQEVLYGGHISLKEYMMTLEVMDDENRKDWEKRMWSEITELRMINADVKALQQALIEKDPEVVVPVFIMDPRQREEMFQLLTYAEKYNTFDIRDTKLLPVPRSREADFDERLREAMDVDALVEDSNQELRDYANQRIPLPQRDLNEKDTDLLSKVNMVAQAIKVDEIPVFSVDINSEYIIEDSLRASLPTEKRILVDEIYKVLYFNNADPQTYTVSFWAEHFQISPAAFRNIVNYVAFPVTCPDSKQVTKVLYFIDSELQQQQQDLLGAGITRDNYLRYLEADYSKRMVEEYAGEKGIFGKVDSTFVIREGEQSPAAIDMLLNNQMAGLLEDKSVLDQIDAEIQQTTEANENRSAKNKNLKSRDDQ